MHVCEGTPWVRWLCTPCGKVPLVRPVVLAHLPLSSGLCPGAVAGGRSSQLPEDRAAFTTQFLFMYRCFIHSGSVLGGMAEQKHLKI